MRLVPALVGTALDAVLSVLIAPCCLSCRVPLDSPTSGPICPSCWLTIRPLAPPLCRRCGDSLPTWRPATPDEEVCPGCEPRAPVIAFARAAGRYEEALRAAIHGLKYDGRIGLARPLSSLMRERGGDALRDADLVVPVPLHWRRQQQRGFNQAALLARGLGLPVCEALRRPRPTPPQVALAASQRHRNLRRAFAPSRSWTWVLPGRDARRVRDAVVVLIDDVSTTGATLDACGEVLLALGAREVRALTAARAQTPARS